MKRIILLLSLITISCFGAQKTEPSSQIAGKHLIINRMIKQNRDKHNGELSPRTHKAVENSQVLLLDLVIKKATQPIPPQTSESTESNLVRAFTNDIRDIVLKDPTEENKKDLKTAMWDLLAILPPRKAVKQSENQPRKEVNVKQDDLQVVFKWPKAVPERVGPSPISTRPNYNPADPYADLMPWNT